MYRRILLTDDGSELARLAIPHAAQFAKAADSEVLVLRVSRAAGEDIGQLSPGSWSDRLVHREFDGSDQRIEAEPPLSEVTGRLLDEGVRAVGQLVVQEDDVGAAIVAVSRKLECDLIIMSTHGLGGIKRTVLGSVADHVVRHARSPVLLCR